MDEPMTRETLVWLGMKGYEVKLRIPLVFYIIAKRGGGEFHPDRPYTDDMSIGYVQQRVYPDGIADQLADKVHSHMVGTGIQWTARHDHDSPLGTDVRGFADVAPGMEVWWVCELNEDIGSRRVFLFKTCEEATVYLVERHETPMDERS